ncbi:MAG: discoidin domain-containing protein [Clostridia bacterium]|nr:discoidin domain-containing protein [Clostridia bacterium]
MKRLLIIMLAASLLLSACVLLSACRETGDDVESGSGTQADTPTEAPGTSGGVTADADTEPATEAETASPMPEAEPMGLANVALGCPVITNDCLNGTNQNLTDGDPDTEYRTNAHKEASYATFPFEVVIDLTRVYPVKEINVVNSQSSPDRTYGKFTVFTSVDGRTYTEAADETKADAGDLGISVPFGQTVGARYVKVVSDDLSDAQSGARQLVLSELEVLAEVDTHDNILPSKRALCMQPGCTDDLTVVFRLTGNYDAIAWSSSDESVVTVNANGHVRAVADGTAALYVNDGKSWTAIPVSVVTPKPSYVISTFYLADHAPNTLETFDYLKECGITCIENCRPYDMYGNFDAEYLRVMAADYGITLSVADATKEDAWLRTSDSTVREIVKKYKNLPAIGGIYLRDEPSRPSQFAWIYRTVRDEDPNMNPHLNLLPAVVSNYQGYVGDWAATVGSLDMVCLSYDMYPFGTAANSFNAQAFDHLDTFRKIGLSYGVDTGYYMAAMGIVGAYREPKDNELMYYASLGVAYGMKEFKWFVWFTPPYSGSGEHFTSGILDSKYRKSKMFDGVTEVDRMLMQLSPYLANCDAVAVYHSDGQNGEKLPAGFCLTADTKRGYVLSVLEDRTTGQQYLVYVNKTFARSSETSFTINDAALDASALKIVSDGVLTGISVADGQFTMQPDAGGLLVFALPAGYKAYERPVSDGVTQSLVSGIGASVSSSKSDGRYAYMLNDGNRTDTGWCSEASDPAPYVYFDLHGSRTFNRVDIYPSGTGASFPKALSVLVSDDGISYREVADIPSVSLSSWGSITFEAVTARYLRVEIDALPAAGTVEIGEIEVWLDNGQVPAMKVMDDVRLTPDEKGNLLYHLKPYVSSSYEEYGFTQNQLTDGKIGFRNGVHQGWCSQIGSKTRDITEWVMFRLGQPIKVSKMIVYPCYDDEFVQDYHLEVSLDGETWTTVWSITGDNMNDGSARVLEFDPVDASFVRFVVTRMGVGNPDSAVGYKVQIGEIELYQ